MNEYKFLKDETIRKEQLQKELSKKKASQKSSGFKFWLSFPRIFPIFDLFSWIVIFKASNQRNI